MNVLKEVKYDCRVSSVLFKNHKENGKKYMFDELEETFWSSDKGTPQHINIDFDVPVQVTAFRIQFQGGFVGKDSHVVITRADTAEDYKEHFYPEDSNKRQEFKLKESLVNVKTFRLVFDSSTDFFGRIVIYSLEILR